MQSEKALAVWLDLVSMERVWLKKMEDMNAFATKGLLEKIAVKQIVSIESF